MNNLYVLGNGQLGNMLAEAGTRLGINVVPLPIDTPIELPKDAVITAEREHWSPSDSINAVINHPGWLNKKTFECIPDRREQKALLDSLQLPTSTWCVVDADSDALQLAEKLGGKYLLKSARDGYDGKGQWRYNGQADATLPDWKSDAIAEKFIDFDTEVSLVGARNKEGQFAFYKLTENFHDNGILQVSLKLENQFDDYQQEAEACLTRLMDSLAYVGVMAAEFFVTEAGLLINEIAPRVHNSGHWTQAGASVSQFELHVRAATGLPFPKIAQSGNSMMVNLIGSALDPAWYSVEGARIHWYGKSVRTGRKLGHVNFHHADKAKLAQWLSSLPVDQRYDRNYDLATQRINHS